MSILPPGDDIAAVRAAIPHDEPWLEAMRLVADRHRLAPLPIRRAKTGSSVVFFVGEEHVIKLYAPMWRAQLEAEGDVLPRVHRRIGVATPELVARGEIEGFPYLVLRRMSGEPLRDVWDGVPPRDRLSIVETLGAALAAIHRVDASGLRLLAPEWPDLVSRRVAAVSDDARALLSPIAPAIASSPCVLVHADAHHEHVLLEERAGRWRMTGLFDFADARLAPPEYDLVTPCAFIVRGDRALARGLLRAVGYADADMTEALARRLFAFELLHAWADVTRDAKMIGAPLGELSGLATAFWPIA